MFDVKAIEVLSTQFAISKILVEMEGHGVSGSYEPSSSHILSSKVETP